MSNYHRRCPLCGDNYCEHSFADRVRADPDRFEQDDEDGPLHDASVETYLVSNESSSSDFIDICTLDGTMIAEVRWPDGGYNATVARAHMMAAGPELYRALRRAFENDLDKGPFKDEVEALLKMAKP